MLSRLKSIIKNNPKIFRNFFIFLTVIVLVSAIIFKYGNMMGSNPREIAENIRGLGILGPIVAISFFVLEVIFTPLPGLIVSIAAGYAFGGFWGAIYTYSGNMIGTLIAFYLSRRFGRPVVEKLVNKKQLDKYDGFLQEKGKVLLWIVYLLPFLPNDIVTFMVGLTDTKWKDFIFIVAIALIPYTIFLNYFGSKIYDSGLDKLTTFLGIILILAFLAGIFIYWGLNLGRGIKKNKD